MGIQDSSQIRNQYEQLKPQYDRLREVVIFILKEIIQKGNIPYDEIYGRVKSLKSFQDKIDRNEYTNPFEEITDICGVRVICLFPSDLPRIANIIENNFSIIVKDDKISAKPSESFGYLSIHYIATIHPSYSGAHYNGLKEMKFEIQLRTIAAHAWCTISHHLDYKQPNAVPPELKKPFQALSALFYLADDNFERIYKESIKAEKNAEEKDLPQIKEADINFVSLTAYLKKRYAGRAEAQKQSIGVLIEELYASGYLTIAKLDDKLTGTDKAVEKVEKDVGGNFHNVGMVRNALSIVDDVYNKRRKVPLRENHVARSNYREYINN